MEYLSLDSLLDPLSALTERFGCDCWPDQELHTSLPEKLTVSIMLQFHGEKHPLASADGPIHTLAHREHTSYVLFTQVICLA